MDQIKVTLQQLLSLYTGGRPVGVRDYSTQYEEFFENYGLLMHLNLLNFNGKQLQEAEEINFKNMLASIELQYPQLKKLKKMCKEYIKKVPAVYDDQADSKILEDEEYKEMTTRLMKAARKVMGKDTKFIVKNMRVFSR